MDVNIHEAKTHLSRLIERVSKGEEITIMKANVPVARLSPVLTEPNKRNFGWARGKVRISEDFDDPLPEDILSSFYK